MKFHDGISFWNIIVAKFQYPQFTKRAITKISYDLFSFSPNILFIIPYQLTQVLSF